MKLLKPFCLSCMFLLLVSCSTGDDEAMWSALKQLQKVSSTVELGINKHEYRKLITDMKFEVENYISKHPSRDVSIEMGKAMQAYLDAHFMWCARYQPLDYESLKKIGEKYNIPENRRIPYTIETLHIALAIILKQADYHVKKSLELAK